MLAHTQEAAMHVNFKASFEALTGFKPVLWQTRIFRRLVTGDAPTMVELPTGLGKTSIIPIWLIALAHSKHADDSQPQLPRRLVYIVNRRTVVDQATEDANQLLRCVYKSGQLDRLHWATHQAIAARGI